MPPQEPPDDEHAETEGRCNAHVHVDGVDDPEPEPLHVGARPGMGTRGGRHGTRDDEGRAERQTCPGDELAKPTLADGWRAARIEAPGLEHDDDRQRERRQPEEEVRHHRQRVQVERDRDPAHRDLRDRDEEGAERRPARIAREPFDAPGAEPGRQGEHDSDQRNHAVAELDERVESLLGIRLRAAARPVLAAEPRPGEAYEGAGRDDEEERDARCERETHERPRRERSRPDRRDRHRYSSTTPEPSSIRPMRAMKRAFRRERGLENRRPLPRHRDEQSARRLWVVGKCLRDLRRHARDVRPGEVPVATIAPGDHAALGQLERAGQGGKLIRLQDRAHSAPGGELVHVAEQAEARDVGHGVRCERPNQVCGVPVQLEHRLDRSVERVGRSDPVALSLEHDPRAEGLRQEEDVARPRARLGPDRVRMDGSDDGEAVLGLGVPDRVPSGEDRSRRAHALLGSREHLAEHLRRQLLRKRRDRKGEQRRAAHREDVVERIRCRDCPESPRIVDQRREEVDGEDDCALVVQAIDGRVVGRVEADEEILGVGGNQAGEDVLEAGRRVLGRATPRPAPET